MRKFILLPALLLAVSVAFAHPAIGIVKDSKGNIYYSDTKQVWKIGLNGKQTVAVPNVHTHELFIDSADNLYGEHLWYNGGQQNTWGHYVWCLKGTGELIKVKEPAEGFLTDYSFVRDAAGNMYWVERFRTIKFKKKTPGRVITTIAENTYRDIRWMYATATGVLYFIDLHHLYKIDTTGKTTLLAKDLAKGSLVQTGPANDIFGIWTDAKENVYCAITSDKVVKKVTPAGVISIVAQSTLPWSPTGGVFDNNGNLWLLECNTNNDQRVRKISKEAQQAGPAPGSKLLNKGIPALVGIILLIMLVLLVKWLISRFKCSGMVTA